MSSVLKPSKAMPTLKALLDQNSDPRRKIPQGLQCIKPPIEKSLSHLPLLTNATFWPHPIFQPEPPCLPLKHPNFQDCWRFSKTLCTFLLLDHCFSCPLGPKCRFCLPSHIKSSRPPEMLLLQGAVSFSPSAQEQPTPGAPEAACPGPS